MASTSNAKLRPQIPLDGVFIGDVYAGWYRNDSQMSKILHTFHIIKPTVFICAVVTHTVLEVPVSTICAGSNESKETEPTSRRIATIEKIPIISTSIFLPVYLQTSCPPLVLFLHINAGWGTLSNENPQNEITDQLTLFIALYRSEGRGSIYGSVGFNDVALRPTRDEDVPSAGRSFILSISSSVHELIMLYAGPVFTQPPVTQRPRSFWPTLLDCEHLTSGGWRKSGAHPFAVDIN